MRVIVIGAGRGRRLMPTTADHSEVLCRSGWPAAARLEMAIQYVAPSRIKLNPDCGVAPGSAADVSLDEVYTKLKNEVEAAKRLREKYG